MNEKRKQDRVLMVDAIKELAASLDVVIEIEFSEGEAFSSPRETLLRLTDNNGLSVFVSIDGKSVQPNVHVVSWHLTPECDKKLTDSFGYVNRHHARKATHIAYGFDALLTELHRGFNLSKNGHAYQESDFDIQG